jgi:peptidoglycan pentaglycine glycine transferase (the first glycine)
VLVDDKQDGDFATMTTLLDHKPRDTQPAENRPYGSNEAAVSERVDELAWDGTLQELGGHFLQSWRWGEFKRHEGWQVERVRVAGVSGVGMAQVLFRRYGPVQTAFVPCGPTIAGDRDLVAFDLLTAIAEVCKQHRALSLALEPLETLPQGVARGFGFVDCATRFSPGRTVIVPLLDDQALLEQMNAGTRHKVRRAQRNGVEVTQESLDGPHLDRFHALLRETADRQGFRIHGPDHYAEALRIFGDDAVMLVASVEDEDVAGLIAARFNRGAVYLFGASATQQPVRGATALLQYEAMRWARSVGCERYDLWGIDRPGVDAADGSVDRSESRECADDDGLCRFKIGFGGKVVVLPRRTIRHDHPYLDRLLRRAYDLRGVVRR